MSELQFDPEKHEYRHEGKRLISVTQALSLVDSRPKDEYFLRRGQLIHLACEYYDRDELDEASVDSEIMPYLNSYRLFLTETGFTPRWIESRHFHPVYQYAGTIDRMGTLNGKTVLIDLKSGAPADVDELQLAAYWGLVKDQITNPLCFDLYLRDDGGMPKLVEVKRPRILFETFLAVLKIQRWREEHERHS